MVCWRLKYVILNSSCRPQVCDDIDAIWRILPMDICYRHRASVHCFEGTLFIKQYIHKRCCHTMDMLWEKFHWIIPLYMKPINVQSKASVVCSVTTALYFDFCLKKLNLFSQHIGKETNEYLNYTEKITRNWNVNLVVALIISWDIT